MNVHGSCSVERREGWQGEPPRERKKGGGARCATHNLTEHFKCSTYDGVHAFLWCSRCPLTHSASANAGWAHRYRDFWRSRKMALSWLREMKSGG
jgi:hypothetical protein